VFWNLPFSSVRQAKRVRQQFSITEDVWDARCKSIRAEHRLPNAREDLERLWKERLASDPGPGDGAGAAAGARVADPADALVYEDE
jgi:hypothetical protein